ncbi:hypothetical protein HO173_012087 [Letharia columbiana]|uniref:Uncharacterized protein n=1 Tax=Letharia columbiana TaxID=112416 RepID=A0A8H6FGG4_9LECA|nr:uncharacterized protein HO173_012087 [Letharia columbiana]KAF6227647.1 hypothetical protein HO173_012087 [Letharia columbiana]
MAQSDRDPAEDTMLEEEATTFVGGLLDADCTSYSDDAGTPTAPPIPRDRPWQANIFYTAAKSISRRLVSGRERTFDRLFPSSFGYTPIEMDDRSLGPAGGHSNTFQINERSTYDMAGSSRAPGAEIETTNAKSATIIEADEPGQLSASDIVSVDGDEPTEEELATLRKVADRLPWSAFIVALVELCERFTYYGLSGPFQNYIQYNPHDTPVRGAIGLGQTGATGLTNFFQFWCYGTPILGAIVSDQYLGKYKTILYSAFIYLAGIFILFCTSLPSAIEHGAALGGLIAAMAVIGLGTGGIKSNVSPLVAEQYRQTKMTIRVLKSGERVIVDPAITIQRIYMIFYLCVNLGCLSPLATTEMEQSTGFWTAYLLCLCFFVLGIAILIAGERYYVVHPPKGSIIIDAFRAMWIGLRNGGNMDAAKPSYQDERGRKYKTSWDDVYIVELQRGLAACRVFLFYPIYWVAYSQMLNNFISQAGTMQLHGIPNDFMQNIDPLTIIFLIPIFDRLLYPGLRKIGIPFRPITRITWGFVFGALAMAYAAIVQHLIYSSPPCYNAPLACDTSHLPNEVHIAVQTPAYFFMAVSEILASVTGLEYAFTKAPPSMKSFVMSIFLLQSAFGSALGMALAPIAKDPRLVWMYTGLCIATLIAARLFWVCFKHLNATEESMNMLENKGEKAVGVGHVDATGALDRSVKGRNRAAISEGEV